MVFSLGSIKPSAYRGSPSSAVRAKPTSSTNLFAGTFPSFKPVARTPGVVRKEAVCLLQIYPPLPVLKISGSKPRGFSENTRPIKRKLCRVSNSLIRNLDPQQLTEDSSHFKTPSSSSPSNTDFAIDESLSGPYRSAVKEWDSKRRD